METRVLLQPAYVLHSQPFQNTSLLVDFFTIDYGRVRAVAKGARREKSKYRSLLQLFHPLLTFLNFYHLQKYDLSLQPYYPHVRQELMI